MIVGTPFLLVTIWLHLPLRKKFLLPHTSLQQWPKSLKTDKDKIKVQNTLGENQPLGL